ncbi:MAG: helix-turn-helix transcriptional regulator [Marinicaulis sp.]|nr:helix-turn-helix transcriptional regulator [Marinicaulis sp.]
MALKQTLSGLGALAHEGRLGLFRLLVKAGPSGLAAGEVADAARINFTTASAQLSVLAHAGLVTNRREGRSIIYMADYDAIRSLIMFLMEDCCQGNAEILGPLVERASRAACCGEAKGAPS